MSAPMSGIVVASMRTLVALVLAMLIGVTGCKRPGRAGARRVAVADGGADGADVAVAAGGELAGDRASVALLIYYLPRPTTPPRPAFDALVAAEAGLTVVDELAAPPTAPAVLYREPTMADVPLPDAASLRAYFQRGLTDAQVDRLASSAAVAGLTFQCPPGAARAQLARAYRLAGALAARTGGVVWSDDARQAFGDEAWRARADAVAEVPPRVGDVINVHAYVPGEGPGLRIVSLGMLQLGLPDLVIEDVPRREGERAAWLLELVAQRLVDGARPDAAGDLVVAVADVGNAAARGRLEAVVGAGARGQARIRLVDAVPDDGDADNRLIRIDAPGASDYHERLAATDAALFGSDDEVRGARDDDRELLAARDRARRALAALAPRFHRGLGEGVGLAVKAPFTTADGRGEYMWIEVRAWDGDVLRGVLIDEPLEVPGLHAGAAVEARQPDVFDYYLAGPAGIIEGNETSAILERRELYRP